MRQGMRALLVVALALVAVGGIAEGADAATTALAVEASGDAEAGRQYYVCAALQAVKIVGLFTANAPLVLAGAIGGGLACGFGW